MLFKLNARRPRRGVLGVIEATLAEGERAFPNVSNEKLARVSR